MIRGDLMVRGRGSSLRLHVDHSNDPCEHNRALWHSRRFHFTQLGSDVFAIAKHLRIYKKVFLVHQSVCCTVISSVPRVHANTLKLCDSCRRGSSDVGPCVCESCSVLRSRGKKWGGRGGGEGQILSGRQGSLCIHPQQYKQEMQAR